MPSRASGYSGYGDTGRRDYGGFDRRPASYGGFERSAAGRPAYGAGRSAAGSAAKPYGAGMGKSAAPALSIKKGDQVRHKAFGDGMVLSVQPTGGDTLVEIAFDNVGTKRLMLKFAAAQMEKI